MVLVITEKHCFYPDEFEYLTPDQWNLEYEPFELQSVDGLTLTGWHILPDKAVEPLNRTVLHLHGNAQNMTGPSPGFLFPGPGRVSSYYLRLSRVRPQPGAPRSGRHYRRRPVRGSNASGSPLWAGRTPDPVRSEHGRFLRGPSIGRFSGD